MSLNMNGPFVVQENFQDFNNYQIMSKVKYGREPVDDKCSALIL